MLYSKDFLLAALIRSTDAIRPPAIDSASHVDTGNNVRFLNDSSPPRCDSVPYGFNLKRRSCEEAVARLPQNVDWIDENLPYVSRDHERDVVGPRYVLPWRELSSDGRCAVDITLEPIIPYDRSTKQPIHAAARKILDTCVAGVGRTGGMISGLGQDGNLRVTIKRSEGPFVQCNDHYPSSGDAPSVESCKLVLTAMPVHFELQIFGPVGPWGDTSVDVIIPRTYRPRGSAASECKVILSTYLPSIDRDQAVGWDIWAAAVKVNTMCIRRGLAGVATGIGTRRGLKIALSKQNLMDSNSTRSDLESFMPGEISQN